MFFHSHSHLYVLLIMPEGIRIYIKRLFFLFIGIIYEVVFSCDRICRTVEFYQVFVFSADTDFVAFEAVTFDAAYYIHLLVIFSGILTVFNYVFISVKKGKNGCLFKEEVFFIYASHGLFIAFLQKTVLKIMRPITEVEFLAIYFLVPILTITISMYGCMKRVTPKVLSILVGGR